MRLLAPLRSMAWLTVFEAIRAKMWLLVVAAGVGILLVVPNLKAVDEAARLRLGTAAITGVVGFLTVMLALLVASNAVRRDLDHKMMHMLLSKPLSRWSYLIGRWSGMVLALIATATGLLMVGALSLWLQVGSLPNPQRLLAPDAWYSVDAFGATAAKDRRRVLQLTGPAGNAAEWTFSGLPTGRELGFLVRGRVRGQVAGITADASRVQVLVGNRVLALHEQSPYGKALTEGLGDLDEGQVALRSRSGEILNINQDFMKMVVPADAVEADGSLRIRVRREDRRAMLQFFPDAAWISVADGSLVGDLFRGGLIIVAQAGLLCGAALLLATIGNLGIALFGGLVLFFGANAVSMVESTVRTQELPRFLARGIEMVFVIIPDFSRFTVSADLAAGMAISWIQVTGAWVYCGAYALGFLLLGWVIMLRTEP